MKSENNQIIVINSLRGIAASLVCFYHFVYTTIDYFDDELTLNIFYFGQKGVQIFFIISGIVIPLSLINLNYNWSNWKSFILKRFIRIEPPYIAAIILAIIYLTIRNYIPGTADIDLTPSITTILLHLGYLIPFFENFNWVNPVFWTLAVEFQYYLCLALLFPLLLHYKFIGRITFYLLFISAGFLPLNYEFFPLWGPYFLIGIVYILFRKSLIHKVEYWVVSIILAVVVYFNLGFTDLIIAVITLLIIHFLSDFKTNLTLFLGKISYSLYLLHTIIGSAFINYMSHYYRETYQKVLVVVIGFFLSVFSAYLLYKFVEKPTHQYARKLKS